MMPQELYDQSNLDADQELDVLRLAISTGAIRRGEMQSTFDFVAFLSERPAADLAVLLVRALKGASE